MKIQFYTNVEIFSNCRSDLANWRSILLNLLILEEVLQLFKAFLSLKTS